MTFYHHMLVARKFNPHEGNVDPHVPKIRSFDGILDLIMLCIIMEFGPILDPRAYGADNNAGRNTLAMIRGRGLARDILEWWDAYFSFIRPDGSQQSARGLFMELFAEHARLLVVYKRMAEKQDITSDNEHCTAFQVERWIACFHSLRFDDLDGIPDWTSMSFDWSGESYAVQWAMARAPHRISMSFYIPPLELH
jgi:hypothetical protein